MSRDVSGVGLSWSCSDRIFFRPFPERSVYQLLVLHYVGLGSPQWSDTEKHSVCDDVRSRVALSWSLGPHQLMRFRNLPLWQGLLDSSSCACYSAFFYLTSDRGKYVRKESVGSG